MHSLLEFLFHTKENLILAGPAAPFIMAFAAIVSTVSSIKQGAAEGEAADLQAQQSEENARLAREKAAEDERGFRIYSKKALSDIKSGYAASGVSLEGSPLDVLAESTSNAEMDALRIRQGGENAAKGFKNEASYARIKGEASRSGGYLSAAGSLLKGGAYMAKSYDTSET